MTVELQDGSNFDGLFDILGKYFFYLDTLNTARLTTVPTQALDAINQYKKKTDTTFDFDASFGALVNADRSWRLTGDATSQAAIADCRVLLIEFVRADTLDTISGIEAALIYLIEQMEADGAYMTPSVVGVGSAEDGGNSTNDLVFVTTDKKADTLAGSTTDSMHLLAEVINLKVTNIDDPLGIVLSLIGEEAAPSNLSEMWPLGLGINTTIVSVSPDDSLVLNGDFETETVTNTPDDWTIKTGTIGTDLTITSAEIQDIVIAGTPASGTYVLAWSDGTLNRPTIHLDWNASQSDVQAALQGIEGLEEVTVVTTGTSPNFTHAVTMTGTVGDVALITAVDHLNTGSITPAQDTAGEVSFRGKSLKILGAVDLYQPVTLSPDVMYCLHFRARKEGTVSTGVTLIELVTDFGGVTEVAAAWGTDVSISTTSSTFGTSFAGYSQAFNIEPDLNMPVYLRINQNTLTGGGNVVIDDLAIYEMTELYPGGPSAVVISGADPPALLDKWTITPTNDRAGNLHEWCDRAFDLKGLRLLFPTTGSTLVPDSLIS